MKRLATGIAVAAVTFFAVFGRSEAAPIAPIPDAAVDNVEQGYVIRAYYWHGRYYRYRWHGAYYRYYWHRGYYHHRAWRYGRWYYY